MREWLLYAPDSQINEATRYYIDTISRAGRDLGLELRHVRSIADVPIKANVLAIECKSAFKLRVARPEARCWLWMQGVVPEEARLQFGSCWREALWNFFERKTLARAPGLLMVSQAMRAHFSRKYGLGDVPTFVMPCVNAEIDPASFLKSDKYLQPSFVYAGSLHAWQCFDLTLAVYRLVKARCPQATLTVLTRELEGARQAVEAAGLSDVEIEFVPLEKLQARLARYKYGFVLRRPHLVNSVATPTKISSYMAAGVIPVMSTAVEDYTAAMREVRPLVMCAILEAETIADAILELETQALQGDDVLRSYRALFENYFDHAGYAATLRQFLRDTGLQGDSPDCCR